MRKIHAEDIKPAFSVAIVASRIHLEVTELSCQGAVNRLHELGLSSDHLTIVWVPSVVEIPLTAQCLAKTKQYEVIIALGTIIEGETLYSDYISDQVSQGCQRVMLDHNIPVIFGILTTFNEAQAHARVGGPEGHRGREAADAAYEMVSVLRQINVDYS